MPAIAVSFLASFFHIGRNTEKASHTVAGIVLCRKPATAPRAIQPASLDDFKCRSIDSTLIPSVGAHIAVSKEKAIAVVAGVANDL